MANKRHYAAIGFDNSFPHFVPARRHTFHASREAAFRALERLGRRITGNARGFVWPASVPGALTDNRWDLIETIAL